MKFISTRDISSSKKLFSFEDAILSGYAPNDGGLFVPEYLPNIDKDTILNVWSKLSYIELAHQVLRLFIDNVEIPDDDLNKIITNSFTYKSDCSHGDDAAADGATPTPIPIPINSKSIPGLYISELYHGPTYCFKDFGLRILINMLGYFASRREQKITLVVATTGDTGPAAVQAIYDLPQTIQSYISIIVHYPNGQISNFQRKQLTTLASDSIKIVCFDGGGDDMDTPIKNIQQQQKSKVSKEKEDDGKASTDDDTKETTTADKKARMICGINSYNIGRPLAQMIHFIWTYLRALEQHKQKGESIKKKKADGDKNEDLDDLDLPIVDVVVPTGAMGNLVGGYMSKRMGIPFGKFVAAVNINDTTHTVIQTGEFYEPTNNEMYKNLCSKCSEKSTKNKKYDPEKLKNKPNYKKFCEAIVEYNFINTTTDEDLYNGIVKYKCSNNHKECSRKISFVSGL